MTVGGTVSLMNGDMAIIREWADAKVSGRHFATEDDLKVARHILASIPAPTMAETEWDAEVHAGLCAEHPENGLVRMLYKDGTLIGCITTDGVVLTLFVENLTPIPGTRLDLTPRRESESTPDHPTELTIEADYRNAPAGTVVAAEGEEAWTKVRDGSWETFGIISGYNNYAMADEARRVLRWGWDA